MANEKSKKKASSVRSFKAKAVAQLSTATLYERAAKAGVAAADKALSRNQELRVAAAAVAAAGPPKGVLVAEGDSWFDLPFLSDVVEELKQMSWKVVSVAHHGDTVESMAYDAGQFSRLEEKLRELADDSKVPRAILLSGGGNDITGDVFEVLLNHVNSGLPAFSDKVIEGMIEERLAAAIVSLAAGTTRVCEELFNRKIPILIHGYGYAVPDGRGFLGGALFFPGPWLQPGFRRKGYDPKADLSTMTQLMTILIDRFNRVLADIVASPGLGHLIHVDLRNDLSNVLNGRAYQRDWSDELHLTKAAYQRVARKIDQAVPPLPPPPPPPPPPGV